MVIGRLRWNGELKYDLKRSVKDGIRQEGESVFNLHHSSPATRGQWGQRE